MTNQKHDKMMLRIMPIAILLALVLMPASAFAQSAIATGGECTAGTLGGMICNILNGTAGTPGIFAGLAYLAGLICGFLAILKLRDHVENPNSTPIWEPIKRFVAGGAFLATPRVVEVVRNTIQGVTGANTTGGNFNGSSSGVGLDAMIVNLVGNIIEPTIWAVGWVGWIAGLIFVFIGISRILKSEQEGPRGPTGIGTLTTFLVAGALFSLNSIVTYMNGTVFGNGAITSNGTLQYTAGLGGAEDHVHAVISAIVAFSMIIGWISLVRGIFIIRGVSEGNSQASMMAALTHLIGGALAINLGGVINAVQNTLGISSYGIIFN